MSLVSEISEETFIRVKELITDRVERNENFKAASTYLSAAPAIGIYEFLYPLHAQIGPPSSVESVLLHSAVFLFEVIGGLISGYLFLKRPSND